MVEKKLFDDVEKTTIANDERIVFQKENTLGSLWISFTNFITQLKGLFVDKATAQTITAVKTFNASPLVPDPTTNLQAVNLRTLNTLVSTPNKIDFNPQTPTQQPHLIGRIFYDSTQNTHTLYNDIPGISLQLGEELRARLVNDTGLTLLDGVAVSVIGAIGASLQVELLDASNLNSAIRGFGLITKEIVNGLPTYAVRYGAVNDIDTSMLAANEIVYGDPAIKGGKTSVRPEAPNYPVRIGMCLISDAINGVIVVDTLAFNGSDTDINLQGTLNGLVTQTPNVAFSVSGGIIYADVTNQLFPTKNLPFMIGGVRYLLNTTTNTGTGGAARIIIPPGNLPSVGDGGQKSWLYVDPNGGTPILGTSTAKPSVVNAGISTQVTYDAATTLSRGKLQGYRRENNASNSETEGIPGSYGFTRVQADDARSRGSAWDSGQDPTPTVDDANVLLALSAGIGKQLHYAVTPAFDGLNYQIYNDIANLTTYALETNLINIVTDAQGGTLLGNGFYYTIRFYYKLNSNGIGNDIIATRPQGHYASDAAAVADVLKYTTLLSDTSIEDIVYPLFDMVIVRTGTGGGLGLTVNLSSIKSLRSKTPGVGGGSGGEGVTTDDKIRISAADAINDFADPKFAAGGGITKTILNPGANEQLEFKTVLAGTGIANGGISDVAQDIDGPKNLLDPITITENSYDVPFFTKRRTDLSQPFDLVSRIGGLVSVIIGSTESIRFLAAGVFALWKTPAADATYNNILTWNPSTKAIEQRESSYEALTAGAAVAYDLLTGLNKTLNVAVDTTITFSNPINGMPTGDIRLNVTVQSDIILAGAGITFAGLGTLTAKAIGVYHLVFVIVSPTVIDYTISDEPYT